MFIHENALCESSSVGEGTQVWAFAHILPNAVVGEDCNICDGVFVENDVVVGDRVTVKCGVQLWDGLRIEDDVFIGPNATFTNDKFPRSKVYPDSFRETIVHKGASIGANATVLPGISIGEEAMVGAGAVVTKDVPPGAIVVGNPARIVGYTDSEIVVEDTMVEAGNGRTELPVGNCFIQKLPQFTDMRGDLVVGEVEKQLPFTPLRWFMVHNVPSREVRGEHAHHKCEQFLICIHGSLNCVLDDGKNKVEVVLDSPSKGLYISSMVWGVQYKYSDDAVLCVFASMEYQTEEYIRDYGEFLKISGS